MNSSRSWPCAALRHAEIGPRTTLRVGGRVEWLLEPADPGELAAAWQASLERGRTPRVLGGGANLIVATDPLPGVVISTERLARVFRVGALEGFAPDPSASADRPEVAAEAARWSELVLPTGPETTDESPRLFAWAGAPMPGLVRVSRELGWSGLEGLAGVPGHLGGGVAMNAGGRWGELWDALERVWLVTPGGELVERARADCAPRYRDGNLGGAVVVAATLVLERAERRDVRDRIRDYLAAKSAAQPVNERSCGCIFRNPDPETSDGRTAGQLIEASGAKGLRRGGAIVSEKHANFIVNRDGATGVDVLGLVEEVARLVLERTGVALVREVQVWGEDDAGGARSGTGAAELGTRLKRR